MLSHARFLVWLRLLRLSCAWIQFDAREATIESVHQALFSGQATCREITQAFISRTVALNGQINAILTLNPLALKVADHLDWQFKAGNATGTLFCIPVLLKDNFDTLDMPTTAGSLRLARSRPSVDAPTVSAFKQAGAIILGKTNLHELALEGLSVSSLGGQTKNPYDLTRTPGGSSGGTGAAIATSMAIIGTGTDTINSIRNPASANSLYGCRPTAGLIGRSGIVPVSYTQDAIGPIARTVTDLATALTVMASVGFDPQDNLTVAVPDEYQNIDYRKSLDSMALAGMRFGLLEGFTDHSDDPEAETVKAAVDFQVKALQKVGAAVVSIDEKLYDSPKLSSSFDVRHLEFREEMDRYFQTSTLGGVHPNTIHEVYNGNDFLVIPSQYEAIRAALGSSTSDAGYKAKLHGIRNLTVALQSTFRRHQLDALIYPQQQSLVLKIGARTQSHRNGILAAVTGFPVVTIPAGFSYATDTAPLGVPIGLEILGRPWQEKKLLQIAYQLEQLAHIRKPPVIAKEAVEMTAFKTVPTIVPDVSSIPRNYPIVSAGISKVTRN